MKGGKLLSYYLASRMAFSLGLASSLWRRSLLPAFIDTTSCAILA
jgi:hypothetical protein